MQLVVGPHTGLCREATRERAEQSTALGHSFQLRALCFSAHEKQRAALSLRHLAFALEPIEMMIKDLKRKIGCGGGGEGRLLGSDTT